MKYRITQSQITDNLNFIDKTFESHFTTMEPFTVTEKAQIGNGLRQIELDVESLCSYIDSLTKTIKDIEFQLSNTLSEYQKLIQSNEIDQQLIGRLKAQGII